MDKMIKKISDSQAFAPDDKLGRLISEYEGDEISEESLELISAAGKGKADFFKFKKQVDSRKSKPQ